MQYVFPENSLESLPNAYVCFVAKIGYKLTLLHYSAYAIIILNQRIIDFWLSPYAISILSYKYTFEFQSIEFYTEEKQEREEYKSLTKQN